MGPLDIINTINNVNREFDRIESFVNSEYNLFLDAFNIDKKIVNAQNRAAKEANRAAKEAEFLSHVDEYKQNVYDIVSKANTESKYNSDITGISKNKRGYASSKIKKLYKKFGTKYIAELILKLSQTYTPIKTGALRDSGIVEYLSDKDTYRIVYGKGLSYAAYVHENMDNYHPIGRAKYLEDAAYTVLNIVRNNNKPLFTFELIIKDNLVILEINNLNIDEFINNENNKNKQLTFDDLDT